MSSDYQQRDLMNGPNVSKEKTYARKFPVPDFKNRFPFRRNPVYDSSELNDWAKWALDFSLLTSEQFRRIQGFGSFCAFYFAFCDDIKRFENLVKHWLLVISVECVYGCISNGKEGSTKTWMKIKQIFDKFENKEFVPINEWPPYVMGIFASLEPIFMSYNPAQRKRMSKVWNYYIDGNIEELEFQAVGQKFVTVEQFLDIRLKSDGVALCIQMIEYSDQIIVPEQVWQEPRWQRLLDLAGLQIICANDILLFEMQFNELKGNSNKMLNLVVVISNLDKIDIKSAMDRVVIMMRDFETELLQIEDEILSDENCPEEVKLFIERINYLIGGNTAGHNFLDK